MTKLTRNEVKFEWNDLCERAFQELKRRLTSVPILIVLIGQKRDVYICTPMCASARVVLSNIVYLGYGYRSTGISALNTEFSF